MSISGGPNAPWTWGIRWSPTLSAATAITTDQVAKVVVYSYRFPETQKLVASDLIKITRWADSACPPQADFF